MKILLEVNDSKVAFLLEILKNFKFVKKATPLTDAKAELMQEIRDAIEELKLVKAGKKEARNAEEFLHEL